MQRLKSMVVDTSATVDEEIVPATNALREAMQKQADLNRDVFLARDRRDAALKAYDRTKAPAGDKRPRPDFLKYLRD